MNNKFLNLTLDYLAWVRALSIKIWINSALKLFFGVLLFLTNQLSIVLAFFLPLKVIILVGSEGVPRYLRAFVTEENKNEFIVWFAIGAFVFYLLFLLTGYLMNRLGVSAATEILGRAKKVALFHQQELFAKDVFLRVARTWGTYFMVFLGFALGLILEWRVFSVLLVFVVAEYAGFAYLWQQYQEPENSAKLMRFLRNRSVILDGVSALNFFTGFGILFYLFLIDSSLNFIIGILLIMMTQQIFRRLVVAINDAVFLVQQKAKIQTVFFTYAHLDTQGKHIHHSFEKMLLPERREALFATAAPGLSQGDVAGWRWVDCNIMGVAVYSLESAEGEKGHACYWLKCYAGDKFNLLQKERLAYERGASGMQGMAPQLINEGSYHGTPFLLLQGGVLKRIQRREFKHRFKAARLKLWSLIPDGQIVSMLQRTFPTLEKRLHKNKLSLMSLASRDADEYGRIARFVERSEIFTDFISTMPLFITNNVFKENNLFLDAEEQPVFLHWHRMALEPVCSDITPNSLEVFFDLEEIAAHLQEHRSDAANITALDLKKIVYLAAIERAISLQLYGEALDLVQPTLEMFDA
ncbi:hypothetical protein Nhal_0404 [Nitrosococcus halophilus Nc 4]|uniref:Uncharacterized protein n=1 Tax=Nitrosococcus halophilus (strain Nc4) TaxID=472759 RepID=D5BVG6_NITHN|nr:hypothetical protein [Nitrosococcus halophilus]ADE13594.1 hypothetical protein Nhal_0404 [Nitrosococcus halophilus Nc 4]